MKIFNEFDGKALKIMEDFEVMLVMLANHSDITFKSPVHDISRRFLNEINEFEPLEGDVK